MRVVACLQARMGSTRLPGKALKEIGGMPILWHVYRRLLACREVDQVVVAVGDQNPKPILDVCEKYAMHWYVGYEADLIQRLTTTCSRFEGDAVLRARADCLFLDPAKLDDLVRFYRDAYPCRRAVSNWPSRLESEGLDAEVWSMELLAELDRNPEVPREDFGTWAIQHGLVAQRYTGHPVNDGPPHLSIDTLEDLIRATRMMKILEAGAGKFESPRRIDPLEYVPWRYAETLKAWEATK